MSEFVPAEDSSWCGMAKGSGNPDSHARYRRKACGRILPILVLLAVFFSPRLLHSAPPSVSSTDAWEKVPAELHTPLEEPAEKISKTLGSEPAISYRTDGRIGLTGLPQQPYESYVNLSWFLPGVDKDGNPVPEENKRSGAYGDSYFDLGLLKISGLSSDETLEKMLKGQNLSEAQRELQAEGFRIIYDLKKTQIADARKARDDRIAHADQLTGKNESAMDAARALRDQRDEGIEACRARKRQMAMAHQAARTALYASLPPLKRGQYSYYGEDGKKVHALENQQRKERRDLDQECSDQAHKLLQEAARIENAAAKENTRAYYEARELRKRAKQDYGTARKQLEAIAKGKLEALEPKLLKVEQDKQERDWREQEAALDREEVRVKDHFAAHAECMLGAARASLEEYRNGPSSASVGEDTADRGDNALVRLSSKCNPQQRATMNSSAEANAKPNLSVSPVENPVAEETRQVLEALLATDRGRQDPGLLLAVERFEVELAFFAQETGKRLKDIARRREALKQAKIKAQKQQPSKKKFRRSFPYPYELTARKFDAHGGQGARFEFKAAVHSRDRGRTWVGAYWPCGPYLVRVALNLNKPVLKRQTKKEWLKPGVFGALYEEWEAEVDGEHEWVPFFDERLKQVESVRETALESLGASGLCDGANYPEWVLATKREQEKLENVVRVAWFQIGQYAMASQASLLEIQQLRRAMDNLERRQDENANRIWDSLMAKIREARSDIQADRKRAEYLISGVDSGYKSLLQRLRHRLDRERQQLYREEIELWVRRVEADREDSRLGLQILISQDQSSRAELLREIEAAARKATRKEDLRRYLRHREALGAYEETLIATHAFLAQYPGDKEAAELLRRIELEFLSQIASKLQREVREVDRLIYEWGGGQIDPQTGEWQWAYLTVPWARWMGIALGETRRKWSTGQEAKARAAEQIVGIQIIMQLLKRGIALQQIPVTAPAIMDALGVRVQDIAGLGESTPENAEATLEKAVLAALGNTDVFLMAEKKQAPAFDRSYLPLYRLGDDWVASDETIGHLVKHWLLVPLAFGQVGHFIARVPQFARAIQAIESYQLGRAALKPAELLVRWQHRLAGIPGAKGLLAQGGDMVLQGYLMGLLTAKAGELASALGQDEERSSYLISFLLTVYQSAGVVQFNRLRLSDLHALSRLNERMERMADRRLEQTRKADSLIEESFRELDSRFRNLYKAGARTRETEAFKAIMRARERMLSKQMEAFSGGKPMVGSSDVFDEMLRLRAVTRLMREAGNAKLIEQELAAVRTLRQQSKVEVKGAATHADALKRHGEALKRQIAAYEARVPEPARDKIAVRKRNNKVLETSERLEFDMKVANVTKQRLEWMREKKAPLAFKDPSQYEQFRTELEVALKSAGLEETVVGLKGTSTTFYSENPKKPLGHHFDQNPNELADIDLDITGAALRERMTAAGKGPHPDPKLRHIYKNRDTMEVFPELTAFVKKWEGILGREVNFVGMTTTGRRPTDASDYILHGTP